MLVHTYLANLRTKIIRCFLFVVVPLVLSAVHWARELRNLKKGNGRRPLR